MSRPKVFINSSGNVCTRVDRGEDPDHCCVYSFIYNGRLYVYGNTPDYDALLRRLSGIFDREICMIPGHMSGIHKDTFNSFWKQSPADLAAEWDRLHAVLKLTGDIA